MFHRDLGLLALRTEGWKGQPDDSRRGRARRVYRLGDSKAGRGLREPQGRDSDSVESGCPGGWERWVLAPENILPES